MRAELEKRGLAGFIVPRADRHQNEYVPPSDERLAWLTGFCIWRRLPPRVGPIRAPRRWLRHCDNAAYPQPWSMPLPAVSMEIARAN